MINQLMHRYGHVMVLIFLAFLMHFQWFNPVTVLSSGDWYHWTNQSIKELYFSWGTWIDFINFGVANIQIPFNLFMLSWSIMVNFGFSFDVAVKVVMFIPIALLSFISPYVFAKNLVNDKNTAFIVAVFYGTTTYGMVNQVPIQFIYAIAPLIMHLFFKAVEINTFDSWIKFAIVYSIGVCYEVRIMFIITFLIIFYFLFFYWRESFLFFKKLAFFASVVIGLNIFWIFPILLGQMTNEVSVVANRGLFGDRLFNLPQSFTIFTWNWTGDRPNDRFETQPIIFLFWVMPLLLVLPLLCLGEEYKQRKRILFFWSISLIGILLTKQSAPPFVFLYEWLYLHVPGFNLFREASKFYIVTAIGYAGVLTYTLALLKGFNWRILKIIPVYIAISIFLLAVFLWNASPLFTARVEGLFVARNIPIDYHMLEYRLSENHEYFRTLWIPVYSRWSFFNNAHPQTSFTALMDDEWKNINKLDSKEKDILFTYRSRNFLNQSYSDHIFDVSSIKYVIVPIQDIENDDNFFRDYGDRGFFIQELDKLPYLKRIDIGTKEVVVYENENYRPHIYTTYEKETIYKEVPFGKVDFQFKNPTEYAVNLKNVSAPVYVNFAEKYHSDWKLRAGDFQWFDVLRDKNYFLSDTNHFENDAKLNSFLIDPKEVCGNDKDACVKNPDGSYDINLTLYFKPQSYFYLGLIISGTTMIGCLGYLLYAWLMGRKIKKNSI